MAAWQVNRFPFVFPFLLLVSLFTGTVLTLFIGERLLRPFRHLTQATDEIASGNFDVRLEGSGRVREVVQLNRSFNEMARELGSIESLRADFINSISHEFRTPIASISGFAKRLKRDSITEEQRNEYLDIIISECERLTKLSGNILLLSSLENTERVTERAKYSLDEQLRRALLLFEPLFQKKGLEVAVSLKAVNIFANEEMLHHLWINLLSNAVKFTPDGGKVEVTLASDYQRAVVSISDTGIGMDEGVKRHIFDKLYQNDKSRATEGNGLGLSLVQRILELENGSIEVESELGKGSSFTVSLPIRI